MKIVYMGTPDFAVNPLHALAEAGYEVTGVVTQPDKPKGRGKSMLPTPVKEEALKHGFPVYQPVKVRDPEFLQVLEKLDPDIIVVAAFGQIIPKSILELPKYGCVNVHASLLPLYRGGAPVHRAIIDGRKETGVTIMYMAEKMDAGDIISQKSTPITDDDNLEIVYDRLTDIGAELLKDTLPSIFDETNDRIPQNPDEVVYAPIIKREDERLDWNKTAREIFNHVRGLYPHPGTFTTYNGQVVKIYKGEIHNCPNAKKHHKDEKNGTIVKIFKDAIGVKVEDGVFIITEIQLSGKKRMSVKDYLNGKNIFEVGTQFE